MRQKVVCFVSHHAKAIVAAAAALFVLFVKIRTGGVVDPEQLKLMEAVALGFLVYGIPNGCPPSA